jgi:hypothetical protein
MWNSSSRKRLSRLLRVLAVTGVLASIAGLWPSAAEAGFQCRNSTYRSCGNYVCCTTRCAWCYNPDTGEVYSFVCGDPDCIGMWV